MLRSNSKSYIEIRDFLDTVPVIETHEHYTGYDEPAGALLPWVLGYFDADIRSASFGMEKEVMDMLSDKTISSDQRFDIFEKIYSRTDKTAYVHGFRTGLRECWGMTEFNRKTFRQLEEKYHDGRRDFYNSLMKRFGIKAKIVDRFFYETRDFVEGKNKNYSEYCRFAFSLPELHNIHNSADITRLDQYIGHRITCLDDYLVCVENYLKKAVEFGIVCFKDQSAYRRTICYDNPCRSEAEKVFNDILYHRREVFGDSEVRALDDWLFHYFLELARRYRLPVQVHTGHMAGVRNDVAKANAANFIPVLELHQDVAFDLFHGNWPYMDEYLFIGKNYPNVYLDLCWVQCIDPLYCIELMKRAVMTVPHSKIMAFGGDTNSIELAVGYLVLARDNVAYALSELADSGWIDTAEARQLAADWFFNNPNEFFKLGFDRFEA